MVIPESTGSFRPSAAISLTKLGSTCLKGILGETKVGKVKKMLPQFPKKSGLFWPFHVNFWQK
jgi:hypothetical protein